VTASRATKESVGKEKTSLAKPKSLSRCSNKQPAWQDFGKKANEQRPPACVMPHFQTGLVSNISTTRWKQQSTSQQSSLADDVQSCRPPSSSEGDTCPAPLGLIGRSHEEPAPLLPSNPIVTHSHIFTCRFSFHLTFLGSSRWNLAVAPNAKLSTFTKNGPAKSRMTPLVWQMPRWPIKGTSQATMGRGVQTRQ
jgi:hypothetical protein